MHSSYQRIDEHVKELSHGIDEHVKELSHEIDKDSVDVPDSDDYEFSWKKLWIYSGPGILMSIAYLDPGNLESDLQAGAVAGYQLIWVLFWATAIGALLQVLAARLGVVTGKSLAELCREHLPRPATIILWIMAEVAIIASDIQEVVGSAIAMHILFGIPLWGGVLVTAVDTFTFLFIHHYGVRKLEAFFAMLVSTMAVCFALGCGISKPDLGGIMKGLIIPDCNDTAKEQAVGMLGAVIMPHNIYLHSALVQSRAINRQNRKQIAEANLYNTIESCASLFVSFLINLCVVAVFAKGFFINNIPRTDIGLKEAGDALFETFGRAAQIVWAIGLLAAGQSSTMTGTFAGQYVMQGFLDLQVAPWLRVLITRSIAIVPSVLVAVLFTTSLDGLDEWLNVVQSIQLPFALLPLLLFSSRPDLLGEFAIRPIIKIMCWSIFFLVMGVNTYLFQDFASSKLPHNGGMYFFYVVLAFCYFGFMIYLSFLHFRRKEEPGSIQFE